MTRGIGAEQVAHMDALRQKVWQHKSLGFDSSNQTNQKKSLFSLEQYAGNVIGCKRGY